MSADAIASRTRPIYLLLWNKYYMDELYWAVLIMGTRALAVVMARFDRLVIDGIVNLFGWLGRAGAIVVEIFDRLAVDGLGVLGTARAAAFAGEKLSYAQTGRVRQYLLMTVVGMLAIVAILMMVI